MPNAKLNKEVSLFLDELKHPLRTEIDMLRQTIIDAHPGLTENIKWNGPNYCHEGGDRITMRIQPPKQLQLIFHRGVKVMKQPKGKLINDVSKLLEWKGNDRAVATFKNASEIKARKSDLATVAQQWIAATK